jgi:rhodanese-related sulfurtransferase
MKKSVFASFVTALLMSLSMVSFGQTNLPLDAFVNKMKSVGNAQVLDVRTPGEWASGKVANAHLINIQDPEFKSKVVKLDKDKPVFIYCAVGGRSAQAAKILTQNGFKQVYNLQGAGYPDLAKKGIK